MHGLVEEYGTFSNAEAQDTRGKIGTPSTDYSLEREIVVSKPHTVAAGLAYTLRS